jgi:Tfp pilus assembly protein PilO
MKLTPRELILAWIAGVVLVFLPTWFFFADPRLADVRDKRDKQQATAAELETERRMMDQKGAWQAKLNEALKTLTVYPESQDVTADMLIKVEGLATKNSLTLTRREPQKEKRHGDIGTLDIKCNWEGTLDALVHFLFALQQDHGMLDISQLYIKSENRGLLKGTFMIDCSYVRSKAAGGPGGPRGSTNGTAAAATAGP